MSLLYGVICDGVGMLVASDCLKRGGEVAVASMIIGILSGLGLLGWGLLGYAAGRLGSAVGISGSGVLEFVSVVAPIVVLVGAGVVLQKRLVGGCLMLAGAAAILLVIGLNAIGGYLAIPSLVAAGLGIWAEYSGENAERLASSGTRTGPSVSSPMMSLPDEIEGGSSSAKGDANAMPVNTARDERLSAEAAEAIKNARAAGYRVEVGTGNVVAFVSENGSRHFCRTNAEIVRAAKYADKMI